MKVKIYNSITNEENTQRLDVEPIIYERLGNDEWLIKEQTLSVEFDNNDKKKFYAADYAAIYKYTDKKYLLTIETKRSSMDVHAGIKQSTTYAKYLKAPFAFACNGKDVIEFNMLTGEEKEYKIEDFPTREELERRGRELEGITSNEMEFYKIPLYQSDDYVPRYYQVNAINAVKRSISHGSNRILLTMATGSGKTFTAFQILYSCYKYRQIPCKKILFLADTNNLVKQPLETIFKVFNGQNGMPKAVLFDNKKIDEAKNADLVFSTYQQMIPEKGKSYFKEFASNFFDFVIIDECHRGSAHDDSLWHTILLYFKDAIQLGLTATPKDKGYNKLYEECKILSKEYKYATGKEKRKIGKKLRSKEKQLEEVKKDLTVDYFGNSVYTYSLKNGIEDGFLAPYNVICVSTNLKNSGLHMKEGKKDVFGNTLKKLDYEPEEIGKQIEVKEDMEIKAEYLINLRKYSNAQMEKAIIFLPTIDDCAKFKIKLENAIRKIEPELLEKYPDYVVQITGGNGDDEIYGKNQLYNFKDVSSSCPVIAITSKLLSTGIDVPTCKWVILNKNVNSMIEFKQIIGRGTRIKENYTVDGVKHHKTSFTIIDFYENYRKFQDPEFDGIPVKVKKIDYTDISNFSSENNNNDKTEEEKEEKERRKKIYVNDEEVYVENEEKIYYDMNGNPINDLPSYQKNELLTAFPEKNDFINHWLSLSTLQRDEFVKNYMPEELLAKYKDYYPFDIFLHQLYDEIMINMETRRMKKSLYIYIDTINDDKKKKLGEVLVKSLPNNSFSQYCNISDTYRQPFFKKLGFSPKKIDKLFGNIENYVSFISELENAMYVEEKV